MKTIRNFFLFSADGPFSASFFVTALIACVLIFLGIAYLSVTGKIPDWVMIGNGALVLGLFWLLLGIINAIVANVKITVMHPEKYKKGFILYPNGEKKEYKRPVWGKFPTSTE